ncbi:MAG TPA: ankyrin repeat domain-containing protein [Candidatus Angelobacter sp.]|jgi:ankyrin repeat protein|nr:ankyrin repeat domain-containing protein [Candidatus Angelobacter sp.]
MTPVEEILQASERGEVSKVRELIGLDRMLANSKGTYDKSPLHWAAEKNHREIAELLLTAGADINAELTWGMTPLQWAANMGSREVAEVLLAHGAQSQLNMWCAAGLGKQNVVESFWVSSNHLKPNAGQTRSRDLGNGQWGKKQPPESYEELVSEAFYIAARNGHVSVAKFLLEKGADINCRGFFGAPGLHWAAINGHQAMVEFLVTHGANLNLRDQQFNATSLGWALEGDRTEIAAFLQTHGATR